MNPLDLAWAAGLFEGEGSFSIQGATPQACVAMTDLDIVERFAELFDLPVHPKKVPHPRKPQWHARACGERALELMTLLEPFLGERRRNRIAEIRTIRQEASGPRPCDICGHVYKPSRRPPSGRNVCSTKCDDRRRFQLDPERKRANARASYNRKKLADGQTSFIGSP